VLVHVRDLSVHFRGTFSQLWGTFDQL
jgi:hypothetical protein